MIIWLFSRCAGGSMDRASDSGSEGWGFESLPAYQSRIIRTLSQWEKGSDYFCFWEDNMDKIISCEFNIEQPVSKLNISCFYAPRNA